MIYLDNAATTFPKPKCMSAEIDRCIRRYCGNPGRSGHILSIQASEKIYECRATLADFFGSSKPENVVFTMNTTYALNLAIKTLYKHGSHVLISNMEHNSVLRPIAELQKRGELSYSVFDVVGTVEDILLELKNKMRQNTTMLVMSHASNICGKIFPLREIGAFCKQHGLIFIVDAAQSAGIADIRMDEWGIDALCAPAHKGLYGPQGLGFVIFGEKKPIRTLIEGGNGTNSLSTDMGLELPESFEGGTLPTPLIAGLDASVKWVKRIGIQNINAHEAALASLLSDRLRSIRGSILYGPNKPETGIILYQNQSISVNELASVLDAKNICTRSGFHCAPLAHNTLGTGDNGALRISIGFFNTNKDIDDIYTVIKSVCK